MPEIILFDDQDRSHLLPLTFTRPSAELRIGILTIREKWEKYLKGNYSWFTEEYLRVKYPFSPGSDTIFINGTICPDEDLAGKINSLNLGESLVQKEILIAARTDEKGASSFDPSKASYKTIEYPAELFKISRVYQLFSLNGKAIEQDFELITKGRTSEKADDSVKIVNPERVFIEPGAKISFAILNASSGPVYIGKDAEIMENSVVRGPFAMCEHSALKIGSKIYGPTTLGPHCKAGGEVNNSIMMGYSNKGHDGFLGNAVIGEWCNLGADTNNSNLKNNYTEVKIWDYTSGRFEKTGLQFCGLIMGDHSKAGINTMFNTGTVVGVAANIFGPGFPRNFIPSFSWGGASGFETFQLKKVYEMADAMSKRRSIDLSPEDQQILESIFNQTAVYRYWEQQNLKQN